MVTDSPMCRIESLDVYEDAIVGIIPSTLRIGRHPFHIQIGSQIVRNDAWNFAPEWPGPPVQFHNRDLIRPGSKHKLRTVNDLRQRDGPHRDAVCRLAARRSRPIYRGHPR